jgi:hypothetical protein
VEVCVGRDVAVWVGSGIDVLAAVCVGVGVNVCVDTGVALATDVKASGSACTGALGSTNALVGVATTVAEEVAVADGIGVLVAIDNAGPAGNSPNRQASTPPPDNRTHSTRLSPTIQATPRRRERSCRPALSSRTGCGVKGTGS